VAEGWRIGVDWGTTRFRAYLIAPSGSIAAKKETDQGILAVSAGGFPAVLQSAVAEWRAAHPDAAVIAAGMVGSRQGWREVPYLSCPAGLADIAGALVGIEADGLGMVRLVPGLTAKDADGIPDVMRGEETQIVGAMAGLGPGSHVVVLPGTHSKWAVLEDERIVSFATYMTGELFSLLRSHSILGRLMRDTRDDEAAFRRGLDTAARPARNLLHHLFGVRTLGLFDEMPPPSLESYLSGLLIGTEIAAAIGAVGSDPPRSVLVIGGDALSTRYVQALAAHGIPAERLGEEVAALGLARIASRAGA
jgi:2-dehydro-3-deoxygalactonokinase